MILEREVKRSSLLTVSKPEIIVSEKFLEY